MSTAASARPRRRSRRGEGERLREEILAATTSLLSETGDADAVSIRAVAQAVGVSPPSIYLHFADKEALLDAACESVFSMLEERFDAACEGVDDPLQCLHLLGREYFAFAHENPEQFRIIFMRRSPEHINQMSPAELAAETAFRRLVGAIVGCQQQGLIGPGEPTAYGIRLWTAIHGLTALMVSKPHFPWPHGDAFVDGTIWTAGLGVIASSCLPPDADFADVRALAERLRAACGDPPGGTTGAPAPAADA